MMDLEELKWLARNATPGAWTVQTGNSWRRIGSAGDGDVLCPTKHPHDGWPDLAGPMGNLRYIAAANPDTVLCLISTIESLQAKVAELEKDWTKEEILNFAADCCLPVRFPREILTFAYGLLGRKTSETL